MTDSCRLLKHEKYHNFIRLLSLLCFSLFFLSLQAEGVDNYTSKVACNGYGAAAWQTFANSGSQILCNIYDKQEDTWGAPVVLSLTDTATNPIIAAISNGDNDISVVVVWKEFSNGMTLLYGAMRPDRANGWTASGRISDGSKDVQNDVTLVMTPLGKIMLAWTAVDAQGLYNHYSSTAILNSANIWNRSTCTSCF